MNQENNNSGNEERKFVESSSFRLLLVALCVILLGTTGYFRGKVHSLDSKNTAMKYELDENRRKILKAQKEVGSGKIIIEPIDGMVHITVEQMVNKT